MKNEIKIKKSGKELNNCYTLSATLTAEQIYTLKNALLISGTRVAFDVYNMFDKAMQSCKELND